MNETLQFLQQFIDRVLTLEPAKLLPLASLALGFALRKWKRFPNGLIPLVTCLFMLLAFPIVAYNPGQRAGKYVIDISLALILWGLAWLAYEKALRKYLGGDDDGPTPPPAPSTP